VSVSDGAVFFAKWLEYAVSRDKIATVPVDRCTCSKQKQTMEFMRTVIGPLSSRWPNRPLQITSFLVGVTALGACAAGANPATTPKPIGALRPSPTANVLMLKVTVLGSRDSLHRKVTP